MKSRIDRCSGDLNVSGTMQGMEISWKGYRGLERSGLDASHWAPYSKWLHKITSKQGEMGELESWKALSEILFGI
jgi:hypothetical protein